MQTQTQIQTQIQTQTQTQVCMEKIDDSFDANELSAIRDSIEIMPKFNQIEILRILHSCKDVTLNGKDVTLNENKYGIHINLSELDNTIIEKLKVYIHYVSTQEINLNNQEKEKEDCLNIYFTKGNKDNLEKNSNVSASET